MTLLEDLSHPGFQEDVGSDWQSTHSLAADAVSGAEIAATPCLLPQLSHTCLSVSGAINGRWIIPLQYSLVHNPLFCEQARSQSVVLGPFRGKSLFLCQVHSFPHSVCAKSH